MSEDNIIIDKKIPFYVSAPVIMITCLIYWPVAVLLTLLRVCINKREMHMAGSIIVVGAYLCGILAIIGIFQFFDGMDGAGMGTIFFVVLGIVHYLVGAFFMSDGNQHRKYVYFVTKERMTSIHEIAQNMENKSFESARKDLQRMIDKGFLADGYIDYNTNEIIIPSLPEKPELPPEEFECQACGAAVSIVEGEDKVCEYCGSELEKKEVS